MKSCKTETECKRVFQYLWLNTADVFRGEDNQVSVSVCCAGKCWCPQHIGRLLTTDGGSSACPVTGALTAWSRSVCGTEPSVVTHGPQTHKYFWRFANGAWKHTGWMYGGFSSCYSMHLTLSPPVFLFFLFFFTFLGLHTYNSLTLFPLKQETKAGHIEWPKFQIANSV